MAGSGKATPTGRGSSGQVLAMTAATYPRNCSRMVAVSGTIVAQAAVELRKLRGVVAASGIGGVEPGLDRGRKKPKHDGRERHQERDHKLHQRDGLGRPMLLG